MSRFNPGQRSASLTTNLAGGEAFVESTELRLVSLLLTSFVKSQFYKSSSDVESEIVELVSTTPDKKFIAQTALYARNEFGMRSVSHIVAGELAHEGSLKGVDWTKNFFNRVVRRPDDATEIIAYYLSTYNKPLPNALKKGIGIALSRFDEYQLAKYQSKSKAVSLVDVVNLTHPIATEALTKLIKGTISPAKTWETGLTQAGQQASTGEEKKELKKAVWGELIAKRKLGYFALLRNLRNILDQADEETIGAAMAMLVDERLIRKSLVLPFRFLTAIKNVGHDRRVIGFLSKALDISCKNVPTLPGKTLVSIDVSGSMGGRPIEIASVFGAMLYKANDSLIQLFHGRAWFHTADPSDSTLSIAKAIERECTNGTDFRVIFDSINQPFERIIILSDMQAWVGHNAPSAELSAYRRRSGANPHIYSFDLAGHGTLQFPERNIYALAGFSEKVFDIMKLLETDRQALIHMIKQIEI